MTFIVRRALRVLVLVVIASAAGLGVSAPALAHSELLSSSPDDGETLAKAPAEVVLTFDEDVLSAGSAIVITGPDGGRYDMANTFAVSGAEASVQLKPATTPGRYNVSYRIVSDDGHVSSAALTYTLSDQGSDGSQSTAPASNPATPASSSTTDDSGSTVWVLGAGAIGIVLIIAVIAVFTRGRRD